MKASMWSTIIWIASTLLFGISMIALIVVPDKWDKSIVIKVCGNLPIVRQQDGSIWLLRRWRAYRVENVDKVC